MAGAIGDLKGGGLFKTHRIRHLDTAIGRETPVFRQTTRARKHRNPRTNATFFNICADFDNRPGQFKTQRKGRLGCVLIFPFNHKEIGEIQAAGRNLYKDLIGLRLRGFHICNQRFHANFRDLTYTHRVASKVIFADPICGD